MLMNGFRFLFPVGVGLLLWALGSCTSSFKGDEVIKLSHTYLLPDSSILGTPKLLLGDKMILRQSHGNPVFEYCKLTGDSLIKLDEFASIGHGPDEFRFPDCYFSVENQKLYVGNWNKDKVYEVPLPQTERFSKTGKWVKVDIPQEANLTFSGSPKTWCVMDDSTFLVSGGESSNIVGVKYSGYENFFSIVRHGRAEPLKELSYPDSGRVDIPIFVKRLQAYSYVEVFKRPNENRYALVGTNPGHYFILFSISDGTAVQVRTVLDEFTLYGLDDSGINCVFNSNQKEGFLCTQVTSRYIYMLESAFSTMDEMYTAKDYKGYPVHYSDRILKYDWEGNLQALYELDVPIEEFIVSTDDSCLYASCLDLENSQEGIVRFVLP